MRPGGGRPHRRSLPFGGLVDDGIIRHCLLGHGLADAGLLKICVLLEICVLWKNAEKREGGFPTVAEHLKRHGTVTFFTVVSSLVLVLSMLRLLGLVLDDSLSQYTPEKCFSTFTGGPVCDASRRMRLGCFLHSRCVTARSNRQVLDVGMQVLETVLSNSKLPGSVLIDVCSKTMF